MRFGVRRAFRRNEVRQAGCRAV